MVEGIQGYSPLDPAAQAQAAKAAAKAMTSEPEELSLGASQRTVQLKRLENLRERIENDPNNTRVARDVLAFFNQSPADIRTQALGIMIGLLNNGNLSVFNVMVAGIEDMVSGGMYDATTLLTLLLALSEIRPTILQLQAKDSLARVESRIREALKTQVGALSEEANLPKEIITQLLSPTAKPAAPLAPQAVIPAQIGQTRPVERVTQPPVAPPPNLQGVAATLGSMVALFFQTPNQDVVTLVTAGGYWSGLYVTPADDAVKQIFGPKKHEKLEKIAIVTDSVISVAYQDFVRPHFIKLIDLMQPLNVDIYKAVYEEFLKEKGYEKVISIHLHPDLERSYPLAKEAWKSLPEDLQEDVVVVNSQCNGLGLGLFIHELSDAIRQNMEFDDVMSLIHQYVARHKYWVFSNQFNPQKNQKWLRDDTNAKSQEQIRKFNYKPIMSLDEKIHIVDSFKDTDWAVKALLEYIEQEFRDRDGRVKRIGIEYKILYRLALQLKSRLRSKHPHCEISLHTAGSVTVDYFGPEMVGVCVM